MAEIAREAPSNRKAFECGSDMGQVAGEGPGRVGSSCGHICSDVVTPELLAGVRVVGVHRAYRVDANLEQIDY